MDLFVIYIGGRHEQSLIELHDIRFVAANSIEDTYNVLKESWWGIRTSLHIDAWGVLNYSDGHKVQLSEQPPAQNSKKLFFVNLGGYDAKQFTEIHKNVFVVAADELQAKQKAVKQVSDWESPHRDSLYEVDDLLNLNELLKSEGYYVHLDEQEEVNPFEFVCAYNPIGKLSDKTGKGTR